MKIKEALDKIWFKYTYDDKDEMYTEIKCCWEEITVFIRRWVFY